MRLLLIKLLTALLAGLMPAGNRLRIWRWPTPGGERGASMFDWHAGLDEPSWVLYDWRPMRVAASLRRLITLYRYDAPPVLTKSEWEHLRHVAFDDYDEAEPHWPVNEDEEMETMAGRLPAICCDCGPDEACECYCHYPEYRWSLS